MYLASAHLDHQPVSTPAIRANSSFVSNVPDSSLVCGGVLTYFWFFFSSMGDMNEFL